jgi:hypothetical protein
MLCAFKESNQATQPKAPPKKLTKKQAKNTAGNR